ncbi:MAG: rhamnulokinase [Bacteroidales bacterium]|jgi:rhamnulokinase|nr:rhamnulokinase [Bacteroidales bacterium]
MEKHHFLAFDIGATSGRSILATLADGKITMKELTRFPNQIIQVHGKYYWDILALYSALVSGMEAASKENVPIDAIGIDTWGVDFVLLGDDGAVVGAPRAYRDPYTNGIPEKFFQLIPQKKVYELTGIQIMNFNTLYQLFAASREQFSALRAAKDLLFMPDALSYLLTGKKICEYTIASTSQLLNPRTRQFDQALMSAANIKQSLMQPLVNPGTVVGYLTDELAASTGLGKVAVVTVAGHDTASAVAAVPSENERFAYLSSGTWSLMGIEVNEPIISTESYNLNFTNEGGVEGTIRFMKNITGMWLLEECRKEWTKDGRKHTYAEIIQLADSAAPFQLFVDPDDPSFANPPSMTEAIAAYCRNTGQQAPVSDGEFARCIFDSLAMKYNDVLKKMMQLAPFAIEKLHVIGGGSQNGLLNRLTASVTGIPVIAGPSEATAIGNVMLQARGLGVVDSLREMREIIKHSVTPVVYLPQDTQKSTYSYKKFTEIIH